MVLNFLKRLHIQLKRLGGLKKTDTSAATSEDTSPQPETSETNLSESDPSISDKTKRSSRRRQGGRRKSERKSSTNLFPATLDTAIRWDIDEFQVPLADGKLRFHDLDLPIEMMHAIFDLGFTYCTPIQAEVLPNTLVGRDATGRAQTGTGKTAAFLISIFTTLTRSPLPETAKRRPGAPRSLILAPTRELVMQIVEEAQNLSKYTSFFTIAIFGGIDYEKQRRMLKGRMIDVLVATPGRLLDFQAQKEVNLSEVEIVVIDEADRMLDMGFIPDVRKIIHSTPQKATRQTLLFSATLTEEVSRLSMQWTKNPVKIEIEPDQVAVDSINQIIYLVTTDEKMALLFNIIRSQNLQRVMVFCNRRDETRRLTNLLTQYQVNCAMISGEIDQKRRIRTLEDFRSGKIQVLVATDVAGRGLHIEAVSHVINYSLPHDPEDYVHRIGRTGRAGASGISISFACEEDSFHIPAIETFLGHELRCIHPNEEWLVLPPLQKRKSEHIEEKPARKRSVRRRRENYSRRPYEGKEKRSAGEV